MRRVSQLPARLPILSVDLERGVYASDIEERLGDEERAISVITMSELLHGALRATAARRTRRLAGLQAIPITEPVARVHADIWSDLAKRGEAIGAHDLWIAAIALAHGLGVATRNASDFERVSGLRVVTAAV